MRTPHPRMSALALTREERRLRRVSKDGRVKPHGSPGDAKHRPKTAQERLLTMRDYAGLLLALIAATTRLTGGRPISWLISFVAATSFAISIPVAIPMPSSI